MFSMLQILNFSAFDTIRPAYGRYILTAVTTCFSSRFNKKNTSLNCMFPVMAKKIIDNKKNVHWFAVAGRVRWICSQIYNLKNYQCLCNLLPLPLRRKKNKINDKFSQSGISPPCWSGVFPMPPPRLGPLTSLWMTIYIVGWPGLHTRRRRPNKVQCV